MVVCWRGLLGKSCGGRCRNLGVVFNSVMFGYWRSDKNVRKSSVFVDSREI